MARVAVAYVEVRPDLKQFGDKLGKGLKRADQIVADHLWDATKKVAAKNLDDQIGLLDRFGKQVVALNRQRETELAAVHGDALKENEAKEKAALKRTLDQQKIMAAWAIDQVDGQKELQQKTQALYDADAKAFEDKVAKQKAIMNRWAIDQVDGQKELQRKTQKVHDNDAKAFEDKVAKQKAIMNRWAIDQVDGQKDLQKKIKEEASKSGGALLSALKGNRRNVEREGDRQGKGFAESFSKQMKLGINLRLGQLAPLLGLVSVTAAPLAQIVSSLGAGLVSLGSAAGVMAASVGVAGVGALLALGQAAGVAAFAVQGMGDSLKTMDNIQTKMAAGIALTQGDLNNYQEAMARLAPSAQKVVTTLGGVNRAVLGIRKGVQDRLFAGIAGDIGLLADAYLPVLQRELNATAGSLNQTARAFGAWATQASVVRQVGAVMAGNTRIVDNLGRAIVPLAGAALTLVQAFQPLAGLLSALIAGWAANLNKTVATAQATGRLAEWVDIMRGAMLQAFTIIGNVGRALWATFNSVLGPGFTLLGLIQDLSLKWATWATSITGRNAMADWAAKAVPTLVELGRLISDIGGMFGRLASKGDAGVFIDQVRTILPPLEALLTQLSASNAAGAFAEGIAAIGKALADLGAGGMLAQAVELAGWLLGNIVALVRAVPGLTSVVSALVASLTMFAAIKLVSTLTGLRQIPLLIGAFGAANTALKAFTASWTVMQAGMGASRISVAISNIKQLGAALMTTTGFVGILRAAMLSLWISMTTNPIGWILIGLGALATAVFAIANASHKADTEVVALATSLGKVGAAQTAAAVEPTIAALRRLSTQTVITRDEWGNFHRTMEQTTAAKMAQAEADQVTAASNQMAEVYGRNVDSIIGNLRAWGVSEKTSSGEILTAMANVQAANGGVALSTEEMSNVLAGIYGVMGKDYGALANTFSGLQAQLASGYGEVGEAAMDSAEKQIVSMLLVLKTAGGMGGYMNRELEAQLNGIAEARKVLDKSQGGGGYDAGIGGAAAGGGAAGAAGKKAGTKTAAGFITSFNAAISDLNPEYLLKKSATWTSVGSNIAGYLAKGLTSGAKNIAKVGKYISKNFGGTIRAIQKEIVKYRAALTVYDPATGKKQGKQYWEDRLSEIKDFQQRVNDSLTAGANLVNWFGFIPTPQEIQVRMDELLAKMRNFTTDLADLQKRGLSDELAAAWLEAGYDTAGNLVEGAKSATDEQLRGYSDTFKTLTSEAQTIADTEATKYFGMGQKQVEGIIRGITSKTTAATTAINTLMNSATNAAKSKLHWTKLGEDAMADFNTGVSSKAASATSGVGGVFGGIRRSQMTVSKTLGKDLANALVKGYEDAIKAKEKHTSAIINAWLKAHKKEADKTNESHSPSKVWYRMGVDTMLGYQLGVESMGKATLAAVDNIVGAVAATPAAELASPTMAPITPAYAGTGAYGELANSAQPPQFNVRVYVGDREITDIVRTEVEGADNTRARALLAGRRGG